MRARDSERARLEDRLVALMGRWLERDPDNPGGTTAFYEWLAVDARRRAEAAGQLPDDYIARVAEGIRLSVLAARMGVARIDVAPVRTMPPATERIEHALETARGAHCAPALDLAVAAGVGRELWDEPCDEWVEVPLGLADGRYVALSVAGESMTPLLHPGDVILVELGAELSRDRMIVARRPEEGYVVKRVGRLTATTIELLSLNPDFAPVTIPRDERLIVGTVVLRWCEHGAGARRAG